MFRSKTLTAVLILMFGIVGQIGYAMAAEPDSAAGYGFGHAPTDREIQRWDIDVGPTGAGLPPGQGTVSKGATVFAAKCAFCHGVTGQEGPNDRLVGGLGTLASRQPIKTIGSYWPFATTLYDYVRRAMPFNAPQSLTNDEVYAVVAWLLHQNGIIPADTMLDAKTLPAIHMPNRNGFVTDPRPDVSNK